MADSRKDTVVPAEVSKLIGRSQEIQGWIDRLADHRDEAPPDVYERVLGDYRTRLETVTVELAQHRAALAASLEERREAVATLQVDRDEQAADLEEARLRHAVGEFTDPEWEERRSRIEDELEGLDELLQVEESAVAELTAIIASIEEGGTPAPAIGQGLEAPPEAARGAEEEVAAAGDAGVVAGDAEDDDEVVDDLGPEEIGPEEDATVTDPSGADTTEATVREEAAADDEASGDYLDELEFLESLSLEEADRFDAVSAMLDDDEKGKNGAEG